MRINIHTYYYGNNYGALLQSLFFKTYLKKQFNVQVNLHSYQPKNFLYREEIKPIIKKNIIHLIHSIKRFLKFRKWKKKYIQSKPNTQFIKREGYALDAGCGNGHVTNILTNFGWNAKGIDFSESGQITDILTAS